jgi:hypothetical protein
MNIYFPNLPISEGKDGAHSTEKDQQFSHEDVRVSEARSNAEYERGTAGEEGDDSGAGKDGGAEGVKGDDTAERIHGKDDSLREESSVQDDEAGDEKNGVNDSPPPPPPSHASNKCNWAQEVNCILPELAPLKCQENECERLVHLMCQSEWVQWEGHDNTVTTYCCLHHPNYINKNQSETNNDSQGTERIDSA